MSRDFGDSTFDPVAYVNGVLSGADAAALPAPGPDAEGDSSVREQDYLKQCAMQSRNALAELEALFSAKSRDITARSLRALQQLPKSVNEIKRVRQEARERQQKLNELKGAARSRSGELAGAIDGSGDDGAPPLLPRENERDAVFIDLLASFDLAKRRMESVSEKLRLAQSLFSAVDRVEKLRHRRPGEPPAAEGGSPLLGDTTTTGTDQSGVTDTDVAAKPSTDEPGAPASRGGADSVEALLSVAEQIQAMHTESLSAALSQFPLCAGALSSLSHSIELIQQEAVPHLDAAFAGRDADLARRLLPVFRLVGYPEQFFVQFEQCLSANLADQWRTAASVSAADDGDGDRPLSGQLRRFVAGLLQSIAEEGQWIESIVDGSETPGHSEESPGQRVGLFLYARAGELMAEQIEAQLLTDQPGQFMEQFGDIDRTLSSQLLGSSSDVANSVDGPASFTWHAQLCFHRAMFPFYAAHAEQEHRLLLDAAAHSFAAASSVSKGLAWQTAIDQFFVQLREAADRCTRLARGVFADDFALSLDAAINAFLTMFVQQIEGADDDGSGGPRRADSARSDQSTADGQPGDHGPIQFDWEEVRTRLDLFALIRSLAKRLRRFAQTLATEHLAKSHAALFQDTASHPLLFAAAQVDENRESTLAVFFGQLTHDGASFWAANKAQDHDKGASESRRVPPEAFLFAQSSERMRSVEEQFDARVFAVLFAPVRASLAQADFMGQYTLSDEEERQLQKAPAAAAAAASRKKKTSTSLPDFSLSPSQAVTTVGEHLLMLPQHLSSVADSPGDVPGINSSSSEGGAPDDRATAASAANWVDRISERTQVALTARLLQPHNRFSPQGLVQLFSDLSYLRNVLSALGQPLVEHFSLLLDLLSLHVQGQKDQQAVQVGQSHEEQELASLLNSLSVEHQNVAKQFLHQMSTV